MKEIITNDNSITFFNEEYQEAYHSITGAIEESFKKFVEPCNIKKVSKIKILDICFGIGYNSAAAIETIRKINPECKIIIYALENDKKILEKIENLNPKLKHYNTIKEVAKNYKYKKENIEINLILGDARETIKKIKEEFDIVFLDPFSPKKCPELWTVEFFKDIKLKGILTTYSCAKTVRENLKKAGFEVRDGPSIGRKSPSTIASKN